MQLISQCVEQTVAMGQALGRHLRGGDLVALNGELGAGKTQWVRGLAVGMGIEAAAVASPTFVLVHEYAPPEGQPLLIHIDAYRLTTLADLESIGWDQPMPEMRQGNVVVIEWADRLGEQLGEDYLAVTLAHAGENQRQIVLEGHGDDWAQRLSGIARTLEAMSKTSNQKTRPCPICKTPVAPDEAEFPFCGKRCRTIDLGRWADESYRISRPIERSDLEEGE